jgi:ATP-dependent exoDNAse (exonuclease V) alpha subunit
MTCHKAQGGEWDTAIVDFSSQTQGRNANFFRWAYTAITRAAKKLIVVNPTDFTAAAFCKVVVASTV